MFNQGYSIATFNKLKSQIINSRNNKKLKTGKETNKFLVQFHLTKVSVLLYYYLKILDIILHLKPQH